MPVDPGEVDIGGVQVELVCQLEIIWWGPGDHPRGPMLGPGWVDKPGAGPFEEPDAAGGGLVLEHLDVGGSAVVVNGDVHEVPAAPTFLAATGGPAGDAMAGPVEAPGLLDVECTSSPGWRRLNRFGGSGGSRRESRFKPRRLRIISMRSWQMDAPREVFKVWARVSRGLGAAANPDFLP